MTLHYLDRPHARWSDVKLQQYMVFCILDTNTGYDTVCMTINHLINEFSSVVAMGIEMDFAFWLRKLGGKKVKRMLKRARYPWYNQKTKYIMEWVKSSYCNPKFLKEASREDLTKIKGIGMKLASMYSRTIHNAETPVAVLDRHIYRWLGYDEAPSTPKQYLAMEAEFLQKAKDLKVDAYILDMELWEKFRRK